MSYQDAVWEEGSFPVLKQSISVLERKQVGRPTGKVQEVEHPNWLYFFDMLIDGRIDVGGRVQSLECDGQI